MHSLQLILMAQSQALAQRCEQRETRITLPISASIQQPHGAKRRSCPIFRSRCRRAGQPLHITRDQPCIKAAGHKILVLQKRNQKITIGLETRDLSQFQAPQQQPERAGTIWACGDKLCDHRIIIGRDLPTLRHACLHTQSRSKVQMMQLANRRQKTLRGIFGIEPRLNGVTLRMDFILLQRQQPPRRNLQLPGHQVYA